jgi:hypothetical protein
VSFKLANSNFKQSTVPFEIKASCWEAQDCIQPIPNQQAANVNLPETRNGSQCTRTATASRVHTHRRFHRARSFRRMLRRLCCLIRFRQRRVCLFSHLPSREGKQTTLGNA